MDLTAGNIDSFEGKNMGVFKDHISEDVLNEWESKYGLHTQHINVSTTSEVMDKLSNLIFRLLQVLERQKSILS
jgi:hypothetical protein